MIYEYRCSDCEQVNEFQMKMSDPHPAICPSCGKSATLERIISRTAFALKGKGWYTSDYKRAASPTETKAEENVKPVENKTVEVSTKTPEPAKTAVSPT